MKVMEYILVSLPSILTMITYSTPMTLNIESNKSSINISPNRILMLILLINKVILADLITIKIKAILISKVVIMEELLLLPMTTIIMPATIVIVKTLTMGMPIRITEEYIVPIIPIIRAKTLILIITQITSLIVVTIIMVVVIRREISLISHINIMVTINLNTMKDILEIVIIQTSQKIMMFQPALFHRI